VRVGDQRYGNGVGRSKKEAEQAAAETAYGELAASLGAPDPVIEGIADEVAESAGD
jgi:ribonuclease-3